MTDPTKFNFFLRRGKLDIKGRVCGTGLEATWSHDRNKEGRDSRRGEFMDIYGHIILIG